MRGRCKAAAVLQAGLQGACVYQEPVSPSALLAVHYSAQSRALARGALNGGLNIAIFASSGTAWSATYKHRAGNDLRRSCPSGRSRPPASEMRH